MKNRILTVLCLMVMLAVLTGACAPAVTPTKEEVPAKTKEKPAFEGRVDPNITATLDYWAFFDPEGENPDHLKGEAAMVKQVVANFNKRFPNVKVKYTLVPWDQINDKLFTAGQAGLGPDVTWLQIQRMAELVEPGLIHPISKEWLADLDLDDWLNFDLDKGYAEFNGELYSMSLSLHGRFLWYNKKLFREAGLDPEKPPVTWEELVDYAKKLTKDKPGGGKQYGLGLAAGEKNCATFEWFWPWIISVDGNKSNLFTPEGKAGWGNEAGQKTFQFAYDLFNTYKVIPQDALAWDCVAVWEHMVAGDIAMAITGGYARDIIVGALGDDAGYGHSPYPAGGRSVNIANSWGMSISKFSKNPDLAWELMKEHLSPEGAKLEAEAEGAVPIRKSVLKEVTDPITLFYAETVGKYGIPTPPSKYHVKAQDVSFAAVQAAILGQKPPADAAKDSAEEFNNLFK